MRERTHQVFRLCPPGNSITCSHGNASELHVRKLGLGKPLEIIQCEKQVVKYGEKQDAEQGPIIAYIVHRKGYIEFTVVLDYLCFVYFL